MHLLSPASLLLLLASGAALQTAGRRTDAGCIDVSPGARHLTIAGHLKLERLPGPPNYESIAGGDAEERTFILRLPQSACIDDGGAFADPGRRFATVQLSATSPATRDFLRAAVGRQVTVTGEGFAAHSGHHHAPLVLIADRVRVR